MRAHTKSTALRWYSRAPKALIRNRPWPILSAATTDNIAMPTAKEDRTEKEGNDARAEASDEKFYSFAKLDQYTFKQRLIIRLAGLLLYWLIRAIGATMKFEVVGWEHHTEDEPLVYCFW